MTTLTKTALSLTISTDPATMEEDGIFHMLCTLHWDDSTTDDGTYLCSWSSSDDTVATINSNVTNGGLTIGVSPGVVTITALYYNIDPGPGQPVYVTDTATLTVTAIPPLAPDPEGRFLLAFDQPTLTPNPVWTRIDEVYPNLVTSYSIDRGRQYELDRFDTGRATVEVADPDGILYPGNPDGPFYGGSGPYGPLIKPLMQAAIGRQNPVTGEWKLRYRGFIDSFNFRFDAGANLNWMTISLVDLFEMLSAEMQPGQFGSTPPTGSEGQIFFESQTVEERIAAALVAFGLSRAFQVIFPGNVMLEKTTYSPGESPLTVVQEAADGEFPGANLFCDRRGRLCFHDRFARFYPADSAAAVGPDKWDYHEWQAGDGAAVNASPSDTVQLREFAFDRGLSRLINSATATPIGIFDFQVPGQLVTEPEAIAYFGIRSWSADGLLTKSSLLDGGDAAAETRLFAWYMVANYKWLRDRITAITFRSLHPDDPRAAALWDFLTTVDIGDTVSITVASPTGTGGYVDYVNIVEGIHEQVRPATGDYDDVTLTLDLSPMADYETNPWPAPEGLIATRGVA